VIILVPDLKLALLAITLLFLQAYTVNCVPSPELVDLSDHD
jgi:hypothetical protein